MPRLGTIRDGQARPLQGSFRRVGVMPRLGTIRDGQARPLQGSFRGVDVILQPCTIRDGQARPLQGSFRGVDVILQPCTIQDGQARPLQGLFVGSALYFNRVQFGTGGPVPYEILFVGLKPASTVDDPGGSLRGVVCPPRSLTGGSFRWVEACLDRVQFGTGGPVPYEILFVGLKPASTVDDPGGSFRGVEAGFNR